MSKGWKNKGAKGAELKIAEEQLKKRNGVIKLVGGIAVFIVVAVLHSWVIVSTEGAGDNMVFRAVVYITAMVCAGFAGYGARDIYRANKAINEVKYALNKKKKKK